MKHQEKVNDALEARQKDMPKDNNGLHFIKPGSHNRKKGYKRKAAKGR